MTAKGNEVELFTDGACIGNPGPGGWAFILRHRATGHTKEASGGARETTNNRMEIAAAIAGLEALKAPCVVALHSDSQYVIKAIRSWMVKWKRLGWRKTANAAARVKNGYLWERLDALLQTHQVTPTWVREHAGHRENERCDALAASAAAAMAAECLAAAANAAAAAANAAATNPSRKDVVDDPR